MIIVLETLFFKKKTFTSSKLNVQNIELTSAAEPEPQGAASFGRSRSRIRSRNAMRLRLRLQQLRLQQYYKIWLGIENWHKM
jgi:hypothetical protein